MIVLFVKWSSFIWVLVQVNFDDYPSTSNTPVQGVGNL
jgi:hypothetical protein